MLKYLSYVFPAASLVALVVMLYPSESAIGNVLMSAPVDLLMGCFALGVLPAILSKNSLELKFAKCLFCLAPAVVLLTRVPAPL